jgi:DNA-binding MarR family transcriptional regulator
MNVPIDYPRFLAVAKHEHECVDFYARVVGCSNGAMSKRLNDLDPLNSRARSKPGYGLLESKPDQMDRRYTIVWLSPKGRNFVEQVVRALEHGSATLR